MFGRIVETYKVNKDIIYKNMTNRAASDKLIWYFYQFDRSFLKVLALSNESDEITLEWYEDIDTLDTSWWENIQVKYLTSKKIILDDWSLSTDKEIGKSILQLVLTYLKTWKKQILLGYYHWQISQIKTISITEINSIIVASKEKITNEGDKEKIDSLFETQKQGFIDNFTIEIVDKDFNSQKSYLKEQISSYCLLTTPAEIEQYYNYGLSKICNMVCNLDERDRKIKKGDFLTFLRNWKEELYNILLYKSIELEKYIKTIKKQHFTYTTLPSYERVFIIQIPSVITLDEIKMIILKIKNKFLKRKWNVPKPYFFIRWINESQLIELKNLLWNEWYPFEDWYYFDWGGLKLDRLLREIKWNDPFVKLKLINSEDDLNVILSEIRGTTEIYQFYQSNILEVSTTRKHIKIFLDDFWWFNPLFS